MLGINLDIDVIPSKVGEVKHIVNTGDRNVLSKFDLSRVPDHVRNAKKDETKMYRTKAEIDRERSDKSS